MANDESCAQNLCDYQCLGCHAWYLALRCNHSTNSITYTRLSCDKRLLFFEETYCTSVHRDRTFRNLHDVLTVDTVRYILCTPVHAGLCFTCTQQLSSATTTETRARDFAWQNTKKTLRGLGMLSCGAPPQPWLQRAFPGGNSEFKPHGGQQTHPHLSRYCSIKSPPSSHGNHPGGSPGRRLSAHCTVRSPVPLPVGFRPPRRAPAPLGELEDDHPAAQQVPARENVAGQFVLAVVQLHLPAWHPSPTVVCAAHYVTSASQAAASTVALIPRPVRPHRARRGSAP